MKKAKKTKPTIGRPTGRKPLLNLRLAAPLHDRLKQESEKSGRTISEETVKRLERSFDRQDLLTEVLTLTVGEEMANELFAEMVALAELAEVNGSMQEVTFYRDPDGVVRTRKILRRKDDE